MGRLIALTAKSMNGETFTKPRVVYLQEDAIVVAPPGRTSLKGTRVIEKLDGKERVFVVYEKALQIEAARNLSSSDILVKQQIALGLAGLGTTQGAGLALTKYFNETTTIGAAATEAFVLPAATVGKVIVVANNDAANDAAKLFPAVGEFIDAQAVNTVLSIAGATTKHLVCTTTAGKWVVAEDFGR